MHSTLQSHFKDALRVLRYSKGTPGTRVQFYLTNDLAVKKSKKQPTKSKSSAEAVYRFLAASTCVVIWICNILSEFKASGLFPVEVFCDSNSAIQIASKPVFHEKTNHFEIYVHLVEEKVSAGVIKIVKIHTSD
ncbi:ribonuclease H-like domain-containing protein [Tanacetum coccineum]